MRWFKHETDDRNKIESRLIRGKFGAEGYGIFQALKELVSEYVISENVNEWGHIHPLHTIETIAVECSVTPERLREFLTYCNEKGIITRDEEKGLYYKDILDRLDNFADRVRRESVPSTKQVRSKYDIEEKRRDKKRTEDIPLPDWLNQKAWTAWVAYRKERKKSLTPMTIKLQLKLLAANQKDHVQIIKNSITNGWTGFFPLKEETNTPSTKKGDYARAHEKRIEGEEDRQKSKETEEANDAFRKTNELTKQLVGQFTP